MTYPWESASILSRRDIQNLSFPRKRESSYFDLVSSMKHRVSPIGESLFLLRQEKEPKEGGPNGDSHQAVGGVPCFLVDLGTNAWGRDLFGAPVGPAEKRRALRGSRRALPEHPQSPDCGCELRSRLRVRASQGSRAATGTVGACFLWVLSLHEERKYLAVRRNLSKPKREKFKDTGFPPSRE